MTRTILSIALIAMCGCRESVGERDGTSVGNPGKGSARVAPGTEVVFQSAIATQVVIGITECDDKADWEVLLDEDVLGLQDSEAFEIPAGTWCGLDLELDGIQIEGSGDDGGSFTIDLEPLRVYLYTSGSEVSEDTSLVIELGSVGWIDATELGLPVDADITPAHDLHETLVLRVEKESGVYADDGNGDLSDQEREENQIGDPDDKDKDFQGDDDKKDGTETPGCATTGTAPLPWFLLLPFLLAYRLKGTSMSQVDTTATQGPRPT